MSNETISAVLATSIIGGIIIGVSIFQNNVFDWFDQRECKIKYNNAYSEKLNKYGDYNKDGEVSENEEVIFKTDFYNKNNIYFINGKTADKNGKEISCDKLADMISKYGS
jgi:hypothetical protein